MRHIYIHKGNSQVSFYLSSYDGANLINDENIKNYIIDNDLEFTADGDIY